jgi:RNA polymerase sigma factor (sigma-70 family)
MKTTFLAGKALEEPLDSNISHTELHARVGERIYRYFKRTVWDSNEAEDLAHATLAALIDSLRTKKYDPSRSFNAWLWIKAHTVFVAWARARGRVPSLLQCDVASSPDRVTIDERLDGAAVLKAMQRELGDEVYEVFVLYYEVGLTLEEVAEAVGRDRKTVATRLKQAHGLAKKLLEGRRT